jgi:hypothetical protein
MGGVMHIVLGEAEVALTVKSSEVDTSRHTGRDLRRLEVELVLKSEAAEEEFRAALKAAGEVPVGLVADSDDADGQWIVVERSSSYREGIPIYHHALELTEWEEIKASALELAGLSLEPYAYSESFGGEALIVTARVIIDRDQQDALFSHEGDRYFQVVRRGLSDEPRLMRMGRCLWSREQETIKQELVLVDRAYDDDEHHLRHGLAEPSGSHLEEMALEDGELLCSLCDLLVESGVISSEGIARLAPTLEKVRHRDSREFLRVIDLDEW